jgi:DNA-binding transcriptional LysR family regulator
MGPSTGRERSLTDWQDIRWFHAVVKNGSFSAAARATGTTQATISRRIKALEAQLGGALFMRRLEGVTLTPLGEMLRHPAETMDKAAVAWARAVDAVHTGRRTIVVTCGELIGGYLSKRLGQLQSGLGGVDIELKPTNTFIDLTKGEADLALRNKRPDAGQLKARKLKSDRYGKFSIFGAKAFFRERQFQTLDELRTRSWIAHARELSQLPSARWIADHIGEDQIRFRMNSTALILDATHKNDALALLPRFIGLGEDHLVEVFGPIEDLVFDMWIVRRDEGYRDETLEALIDNVTQVFN